MRWKSACKKNLDETSDMFEDYYEIKFFPIRRYKPSKKRLSEFKSDCKKITDEILKIKQKDQEVGRNQRVPYCRLPKFIMETFDMVN